MKKSHASCQPDLVKLYRKAMAHGFTLEEVDRQIKKHLKRLEIAEKRDSQKTLARKKSIGRRLALPMRLVAYAVPSVFIIIGLYLLGSVVAPIFSYYLSDSVSAFMSPPLVAPIPEDELLGSTPMVVLRQLEDKKEEVKTQIVDSVEVDFTNLANWFGPGQMPDFSAENVPIKEYTLDIPKLKIHNAKVNVGGTDLKKSLLAYPGTALPGQHGSPVIFGHSVLRRFYNPSEKNPRRYMSMFSTIMTLKPGDEVYVTADGVKYTYVVKDKKEVKPEDVYILTQKYDAKKLKLVTCVPEGTTLKRGVVEAELKE